MRRNILIYLVTYIFIIIYIFIDINFFKTSQSKYLIKISDKFISDINCNEWVKNFKIINIEHNAPAIKYVDNILIAFKTNNVENYIYKSNIFSNNLNIIANPCNIEYHKNFDKNRFSTDFVKSNLLSPFNSEKSILIETFDEKSKNELIIDIILKFLMLVIYFHLIIILINIIINNQLYFINKKFKTIN